MVPSLNHSFSKNINFSIDDDDALEDDDLNIFIVQGALIACISASLPIILDFILDYFLRTPEIAIHAYIPRKELFLALCIPDAIFLFVLIPQNEYVFLAGI
jgi:hypothetical protein